MSLSFLNPTALLALVLVPLLIAIPLVGRARGSQTVQFWSGLVLRALILLAVILGLAGAQLVLPVNHTTVVFVVGPFGQCDGGGTAAGGNVCPRGIANDASRRPRRAGGLWRKCSGRAAGVRRKCASVDHFDSAHGADESGVRAAARVSRC